MNGEQKIMRERGALWAPTLSHTAPEGASQSRPHPSGKLGDLDPSFCHSHTASMEGWAMVAEE